MNSSEEAEEENILAENEAGETTLAKKPDLNQYLTVSDIDAHNRPPSRSSIGKLPGGSHFGHKSFDPAELNTSEEDLNPSNLMTSITPFREL